MAKEAQTYEAPQVGTILVYIIAADSHPKSIINSNSLGRSTRINTKMDNFMCQTNVLFSMAMDTAVV